MNRLTTTALIAASLLLPVSCAREVAEAEHHSTDRVLEAWVRENYGALKKDTAGVYILDFQEGDGRAAGDSSYIFVNYICKSLDNRVSSTNDPLLLEKHGSIESYTYVGPRIWRLGQGAIPSGLESVIRRMKEGGSVTVAIPVGKSSVTNRVYATSIPNAVEVNNVIYKIELQRVIEDIKSYQDSLLKDFSKKHFGGVDSVCDGFYFVRVGFRPEEDSIADETGLAIRYVGRRLDGVVFDTNIKDSARRFKLKSVSGDSLYFTYYRSLNKMLSSNSGYISGFTMAVNRMKFHDTVEVFFRSDYGYGAAGSGVSIPEYSPLNFKVFIQESYANDSE